MSRTKYLLNVYYNAPKPNDMLDFEIDGVLTANGYSRISEGWDKKMKMRDMLYKRVNKGAK